MNDELENSHEIIIYYIIISETAQFKEGFQRNEIYEIKGCKKTIFNILFFFLFICHFRYVD